MLARRQRRRAHLAAVLGGERVIEVATACAAENDCQWVRMLAKMTPREEKRNLAIMLMSTKQVLCFSGLWLGEIDENLLETAMQSGNLELCRYSKNEGASDFNNALMYVAYSGRANICRMLCTWGATDFDMALVHAAGGGHVNTCRMLRKFAVEVGKPLGATDFNYALACAACRGHANACRMLRSWGATDFDMALEWAARGHYANVCRMLRCWKAK